MLTRLSRPAVRLVERWLPDAYLFVLVLTVVAALAAMAVERTAPLELLRIWGGGFWDLLGFSMQMLLVLVTGFMLANTPPMKAGLTHLARLARGPGSAIVLVSLVALTASWINWGFGLVIGALFARELARHIDVDYRLLVASAYSGFVVWHGGLSGSVPLTLATEGHFMAAQTGVIPTGQTLFAGFNLLLLGLLFVLVPLVNRLMLPPPGERILHRPDPLPEPDAATPSDTPAERLEHSRALPLLIGAAGIAYLVDHFAVRGGGLNLNIVIFAFLMLAIALHGTPRRLLDSLQQAIRGGAGIVIQFPFYAGIMAIMVKTGLATTLSEAFVSLATADSLPLYTFLSAGLLNLFVPSGGGQWAVQAPVMIPAAQALGADLPRVAMAVAWGDAWTNLLQPFWALPLLALAGLRAKDIMGYCLVQLVVVGVVVGVMLRLF